MINILKKFSSIFRSTLSIKTPSNAANLTTFLSAFTFRVWLSLAACTVVCAFFLVFAQTYAIHAMNEKDRHLDFFESVFIAYVALLQRGKVFGRLQDTYRSALHAKFFS